MTSSARVFAILTLLSIPCRVQAEGVVDKHVSAVGGQDAIAAIKTARRTGTVSGTSVYGPLRGTFEEVFDFSNRSGYTSFEVVGFSRQVGWSNDSGWTRDTQSGLADMSEQEMSFVSYVNRPSPLAALRVQHGNSSLKEVGERDFNGRKCSVVAYGDGSVTFFVNQDSHLLEGMSVAGTSEVTYGDYREVDGVQFPGNVTTLIEAQQLTMIYDYETITINGKVDAAKFKRPTANMRANSDRRTTNENDASPALDANQIITYLDKNGDRKISKDEANAELKASFQSIDTSGDGFIDTKEAQVMMSFVNQSRDAAAKPEFAFVPVTANQIIDSMDVNDDGQIGKSEATEDLRLYFADYDKNSDGSIDAVEARDIADHVNRNRKAPIEPTNAKPRVTAKQILQSLDKNGDGKINRGEASDDLKPHFDSIDANHDGSIDLTETKAIADYVNQ